MAIYDVSSFQWDEQRTVADLDIDEARQAVCLLLSGTDDIRKLASTLLGFEQAAIPAVPMACKFELDTAKPNDINPYLKANK